MEFEFVVETPKQESRPQQQRESNVDWDAVNNYQAEVLGVGKQNVIGVVTQLYDLGIQERAEQVILWDAKGQVDHGWRFETWEDSGLQKDESARLEVRKYKGKQQECLVFQPKPVAQLAIAVDFPEKMLNLGSFFGQEDSSEKPFRDIIGTNGFGGFRMIDGKRVNVIARPFNLVETDVNSKKKDTPAHYAFAKNSMMYDLADYCGVLDEEGNFHIKDLGKLLGKACMFELDVKWNTWNDKTTGAERRKLETDIRPASRMGPRDLPYFTTELSPKLDQDIFGGLMFKGGNRERDLKEVRAAVLNTMQLATNWADSKLKIELEAAKGSQNASVDVPKPTPVESKAPSVVDVPPVVNNPSTVDTQTDVPDLADGWYDDIPF